MEKKKQSQVRMFLAVQQVCETYMNELSAFPAAQMVFDQVVSLTGAIQDAFQIQVKDFRGITQRKNLYRERMTTQALIVSRTLVYIARKREDIDLIEEVNFTKTEFEKSSELRIKEICDRILDAAISNQAELQTVGIDEDMISELSLWIGKFAELRVQPRVAIVDRKNATSQIARFVNEAAFLLRESLDPMMLKFKGTVFYEKYQSARIIIDPRTNTTVTEASDTEASGSNLESDNGIILQ